MQKIQFEGEIARNFVNQESCFRMEFTPKAWNVVLFVRYSGGRKNPRAEKVWATEVYTGRTLVFWGISASDAAEELVREHFAQLKREKEAEARLAREALLEPEVDTELLYEQMAELRYVIDYGDN